MVLIKVFRVTSINDPETGHPGKQIELVEARKRSPQNLGGAGPEAQVIKGILGQFQSMGVVPQKRQISFPKMTLFLTEDEYDLLGIRFDVNEIYDFIMRDGTFTLRSSSEGI